MTKTNTKYHRAFTKKHAFIGQISAWMASLFGMLYLITTVLGFISLKSPDDPIEDPFFTMMELLVILIAPLMTISIVFVHQYAKREYRVFSHISLVFMIIMTIITSSVHFVILAMGDQSEQMKHVLSFEWPSLAYALDILAWDWFFGLAMLFAASVFKYSKKEKLVRILMLMAGTLSLMGLIGVPLNNMQLRNIGVIGYGVIAPIAFLYLGLVFREALVKE